MFYRVFYDSVVIAHLFHSQCCNYKLVDLKETKIHSPDLNNSTNRILLVINNKHDNNIVRPNITIYCIFAKTL